MNLFRNVVSRSNGGICISLNDITIFLIFICLCNMLTISISTRNTPSQDYDQTGDLYIARGSDIHSLVWIVELSSNCSIKEISNNFCDYDNYTQKQSPGYKIPVCKLIVLKKMEPFYNTYLIAHPYFRLYNKFKRKFRRNYSNYQDFLFLNDSKIGNSNRIKYNYNLNKYRNLLNYSDTKLFLTIEKYMQSYIKQSPCIVYANQEILRQRVKRAKVEFSDPLFKDQWHLINNASNEYDVNVVGAWESGITGRGVTVCVIDDGLEWRHPDLRDNYDPRGSYDLKSDDFDPSPVKNGEKNEHGTRCAGEIAAVANDVCGVGVAYRANISGIRVLGERMTDSMEAAAFTQGLAFNDVYSCSWGPNDDGKTVDGPRYLAKKALYHGITYGRNGYGAIYVVASGNGGTNKDNCNFDGYANSVYTVTIGAVDSEGKMAYYAEECATMLAVTPSSGSNNKAIVTTDWSGSSPSGCTFQHSGTSAAAPLAAAVIALALEMQPCLSWRDVQYLIALSSRKIDFNNSDWVVNSAGMHHSHQHGFGLIDATGIVSAAAVWESVPFSTSFRSILIYSNAEIPSLRDRKLTVNHTIYEDVLKGYGLHILEFVQVYITLEHQYRGSLKISLTCPSGTSSVLASPRIFDNSSQGLQHWPLGTVRCWGEIPHGVFSLAIEQTQDNQGKGKLISWQIALHGSPMTQNEFQERRKLVTRALKGEVVHVNNRSRLCHSPEVNFESFTTLSEQTLKILVITGVLICLMALYNTLEYIFCYDSEKKKFYQRLTDLVRSRTLLSKRPNASQSLPNTIIAGDAIGGDESLTLLESQSVELRNIGSCTSSQMFADINIGGEFDRKSGLVSPTSSCEADVSSDNSSGDCDTISSRNTSDTVVPRESEDPGATTTTSATDHTTSEPDDVVNITRVLKYKT